MSAPGARNGPRCGALAEAMPSALAHPIGCLGPASAHEMGSSVILRAVRCEATREWFKAAAARGRPRDVWLGARRGALAAMPRVALTVLSTNRGRCSTYWSYL